MQDAGSKMQDTGSKMQDAVSIDDCRLMIDDCRSRSPCCHFERLVRRSSLGRRWKREIFDVKPVIRARFLRSVEMTDKDIRMAERVRSAGQLRLSTVNGKRSTDNGHLRLSIVD